MYDSENRSKILTSSGMFPFAGAGTMDSGALVERRWEGPTEDPVKNGACLTNVRPRRGL